MHTLVYVSSATEVFSSKNLTELLEKARRHNQSQDITGMLLYKDGNFMQLLEGPRDPVISLMTKIKNDPRHRGVIVLLEEGITQRTFENWSMGFRSLDIETLREVPGYSDFMQESLTGEMFQAHPTEALKLLLHFKQITN